jgi:tetratricopeptide (TPR) repeat protein
MTLSSKPGKYVLMAIEIAVFLGLVIWVSKAYVASVVSNQSKLESLRRAAQFDPGNADLQLKLARIYQYEPAAIDSDKASEHLRRALQLDPYDPQVWLELGTALDFQGKTTEAEACLRRADWLAPNLPIYQWSIGNYFLLHGNVPEAFQHFRVVLKSSENYNDTIFDIAWKASGNARTILEQLIPDSPVPEFSYLNYLISHQHLDATYDLWRRIVQSPEPFPPASASRYIDQLIASRHPEDAYQVWTDLITKGLIKAPERGGEQNLLINGNFEEEILNLGFGWRILPLEGVYAGIDPTIYHSPGHSILVEFSGNQNVSYAHVLEFVPIEPKRSYQLQGFMKTEEITTDSGPRLQVHDYYHPEALNKFSEGLMGSSVGWVPLTLEFTTGPKTQLIVVSLSRPPSQKLDNLIKGKVWIDDLVLTRVSATTPRVRPKPSTEPGVWP